MTYNDLSSGPCTLYQRLGPFSLRKEVSIYSVLIENKYGNIQSWVTLSMSWTIWEIRYF